MLICTGTIQDQDVYVYVYIWNATGTVGNGREPRERHSITLGLATTYQRLQVLPEADCRKQWIHPASRDAVVVVVLPPSAEATTLLPGRRQHQRLQPCPVYSDTHAAHARFFSKMVRYYHEPCDREVTRRWSGGADTLAKALTCMPREQKGHERRQRLCRCAWGGFGTIPRWCTLW